MFVFLYVASVVPKLGSDISNQPKINETVYFDRRAMFGAWFDLYLNFHKINQSIEIYRPRRRHLIGALRYSLRYAEDAMLADKKCATLTRCRVIQMCAFDIGTFFKCFYAKISTYSLSLAHSSRILLILSV